MSESRSSDIPEPIRTHLDHCEGLISCVDKNMTYRTERALRCGTDFLREASLAWLMHRHIEADDDPLDSFVQHANKRAVVLVDSIKRSLADFDAHPPVHPYQCTKPELQQELDRHYSLTHAMRDLMTQVERGMEVYLPCKKGDWIMTGSGTGLVRDVEGTTVHAFVPDQWGSENAFVAEPATYMQIVVVPDTGSSYINFPSYYFLCDAWRWNRSASVQSDMRHLDSNALAEHAERSVKYAILAWISEHVLWMEEYRHTNFDKLLDALCELDAPAKLSDAAREFANALQQYRDGLEAENTCATGLPRCGEIFVRNWQICEIVGKACHVLEFLEPGDWVAFDEGEKRGKVVWRQYSYLKVATEYGYVFRLSVYSGPVERIPAPENADFPDSACFRRLVWFESHPDVGELDICQCCGCPASDSEDDEVCAVCGFLNIWGRNYDERDFERIQRVRKLLDGLIEPVPMDELSDGLKNIVSVLAGLDWHIEEGANAVRKYLDEMPDGIESLFDSDVHGTIQNCF